MHKFRTNRRVKSDNVEKGIHGTLAEQNRAYAAIEGKHGGMSDDWGFYLNTMQLYRHDHETMMIFSRGYHDHEPR